MKKSITASSINTHEPLEEDDEHHHHHKEVRFQDITLNHHPHHHHHANNPKKHYEPLTWDQFYDELSFLDDGTSTYRAGHEGGLVFCIHGAGHSAMSFACLAKEVKHFATVVAFDFKGHGASKKYTNTSDLSIGAMIDETIHVLKEVMQKHPSKNIVLVGHSLGGSIAARVADILTNKEKEEKIVGAVILDVVEGTAIEALPFMKQIIQERPRYFDSPEAAIKWSLQTSTLRKLESARASIPPQLLKVQHNGKEKYTWRVDLKDTERYWHQWFEGLSKIFLSLKIPKILVTAERDRLDKVLTIAQVEGRFKLEILHGVGHFVQEDDCKGTAKLIYEFLMDFRIAMTKSEVSQKELIGIANFHPTLPKYCL